MQEDRIMQQVDRMVASGRITEEEATQLSAAQGTPEFDAVIAGIRARHAAAHIEAAVAEGEMSREEAEGFVARLRGGEHPEGLRARLRLRRSAQGEFS